MNIIIYAVLCNRLCLLEIFLGWKDVQTRRMKKEKKQMDFLEAELMFLKSQNNCLLVINETFKSNDKLASQ